MKVVHCKKEDYDVYIGRGRCPKTGKVGKWGNPFILGKHGDRKTVIRKFEIYLQNSPKLLNSLDKLYGKTLGCWCSPEECHGDILVKYVDSHVGSITYHSRVEPFVFMIYCEICKLPMNIVEDSNYKCKNNHLYNFFSRKFS